MSDNVKTISVDKIKKYRRDNGWSQYLLAKASGLSLCTIQRVEKDGKSSAETQLALAATFNVSPKELFHISSTPNVHWNWRNIMQNTFALLIVAGAIFMLQELAGGYDMFIDLYSLGFLALFMYAATVIAFGSNGLVKSLLGLKLLFSQQVEPSVATIQLQQIFSKQILFLYGGALIALLTGSIAIHSSDEAIQSNAIFHHAYAVNILIFFYAAVFAEGILRPLATKLSIPE